VGSTSLASRTDLDLAEVPIAIDDLVKEVQRRLPRRRRRDVPR
jgi:hypothetical protein